MSDDTNPPTQPAFVAVPNAGDPPAADAPATETPPAPPAAPVKRTKRTQATVTKTDPVTATVTTTDVVTETVIEALPESATLAAPYAYYEDDGALRSWSAGQVLVDADEIAMLLDRGALFTAE